MDVSDRRMQVQLTRKFCLRQNLSPRATGFVDPEGLGKSTCRKQKSSLISILSGRFLRLWALSTVWRAGSFPGPVLLDAFRLRRHPPGDNAPTFPRFRRQPERRGALRGDAGKAKGLDGGASAAHIALPQRAANAGKRTRDAAKAQNKRPWAETLRCHSLCAVVSFSYPAGVCAGTVGVALASGEAPGDAMRMGVMTSPPRTPKLSVSGKR